MQVNLVDSHPLQQHIENPCKSFFKRYFNTNSLITAILFALPIYISLLGDGFFIRLIISFVAISAFFAFFSLKQNFFQTGFFIGMFWFWWIGLSFRYYNLTYLVPVVIVLISLGYGFVFWILNKIFTLLKFPVILWGIFFVFGFDYLHPFTFDWLKPEVLISNSLFMPSKLTLFLLIAAALLFRYKRAGFLLLIAAAFFVPKPSMQLPPLKIKLITTHVPQDKKWQKEYIKKEIKANFKYIKNAIKEHYDVVVLPESAFPLFLNTEPDLLNTLKKLSEKITIVTGALHLKNNKFYNSTYIFENKNVKILDKHILVPFGEYIPLPFFEKEINTLFFGGASDYQTSSHFGIFTIKNIKFINAICYEATVEKLYTLKPHYIIALSNDAWFIPSIEPVLQKLLINIYALNHRKVVFHSINGYESYVIK